GRTVVVVVSGLMAGKDSLLMIKTGIALAVATIPEGLPIVATIALARGMLRMARKRALVTRLSAVETLGATNIICTDKTGTLTENRMTIVKVKTASNTYDLTGKGLALEGQFMQNGQPIDPTNCETLKELLECGVLCNNAHLYRSDEGGVQASGDPLEVALLVAGAKAGIERESLLERLPEVREEAFDSETKMMATFHSHSDNFLVCVKGAAESVLDHCRFLARDGEELPIQEEERSAWLKQNDELAAKGLRVLALARKIVSNKDENPYQDLVFLGLVAMEDPPRSDVKQSIQLCQEAGIRVIMVTGDQPKTARSIAVQVGVVENDEALVIEGKDLKPPEEMTSMEKEKLLSAQIFARVSPRQKLDLIALHQKNGSVVAMTGDGVNDAPALKKADIGIAMGQRGTQVAQQTADMVLQDDAFSTIVVAVQEGRIIFENIRKFVLFLLSCNISEVLIISLASIVRAPLPLTPLQILFLNVVTDVFP